MSRSITVAAVQLDAALSSVVSRLERAEKLIANAVADGAQLVVLPAQFATGTSYDEVLYERSEPLDGQIVEWMLAQAKQHGVYLAGSLLLWDVDEIYHAALLIAPDGQIWRYDQQFPYLWERTLFRDGDRILIADTELGKIGLLLNWDAAHSELWERYAANVDIMLLLHSIPNTAQMQITLGKTTHNWQELGLGFLLNDHTAYLSNASAQVPWMNTPLVMAGGAGTFKSLLPIPRQSLVPLIALRSDLWAHINEAHDVVLTAPFVQCTALYGASGNLINQTKTPDDQIVIGQLILESLPHPEGDQPKTFPLSTLMAIDAVTAATMSPVYQRGARRQWGARMAPASSKTRIWVWTLIFCMIISFLLGRFLKRF